jgi:NAD(P)-dependent dehydrogenase (short-subunit alcohol dehydrogenase family)
LRFEGKVALVTGGTSGIGTAVVEQFLAEGARVMITDKDPARGEKVIAALAKPERPVEFFAADLRDDGVSDAIVEACVSRLGGLDVLVNNAAVLYRRGTLETSDEQWLEAMAVNLNAVFFMCRAAARAMKDAGGAIVNISSDFGVFAVDGAISYCTTKAAVVQLTKAVALDLARFGIRVNAIAPGKIQTDMLESSITQRGLSVEDGVARISRFVPLHRIGQPDEIAKAIAFLASEDASFITGATLTADGGGAAAGPGGVIEAEAPAS